MRRLPTHTELAFLDTLLERNNVKISVLVYRKPTYTDQYLHHSSHQKANCKESDENISISQIKIT